MPAWLGIIGAVVGIVVFFGTVVVYFRGSADKGTITTLQNSNEALIQRVAVLESNEVRLMVRVEHLERENQHLLTQRPSAEAISELETKVDNLVLRLQQHDEETHRAFEELK